MPQTPMSYRKLLSNLPSMASVVNSFQSPEVQLEVYQSLVRALEQMEGSSISAEPARSGAGSVDENGVVAHDIVDGGNIHAGDED